MHRNIDITTAIGALALLLIGLFVLLDSTGAIDLTFGWALTLLLFGGGTTLLASGSRHRDRC